ncbi:MAG: thiolase family protein [Micrococcaceae bacterium]
MNDDVVIVAGSRTSITGRSRAQAELRADQLGATVVRELVSAFGVSPSAVILGNCTGPGGNIGRLAALGAGCGEAVVGWGVDAQCGSGLLAIQQGLEHVQRTGSAVIAGGAESPSTAPQRIDVTTGRTITQARFAPEGFPDPDMTAAADELARIRTISRTRQDHFAARSHRLARAAQNSVQTVETRQAGETASTSADDGPRDLTPQTLARFAPLFGENPDHTVTPGNTARIADGAAAVLMLPARDAARLTTAPSTGASCRVVASQLTGAATDLPGIAAVSAVRAVLATAGRSLDDVAAIEIVEAYAAQALACLDELGLTDPQHSDAVDPRVNAHGGALALGHPWGASGAVAVVQLLDRLADTPPGTLGLAACAIGGGMGAALLLERVDPRESGQPSDPGEPGALS